MRIPKLKRNPDGRAFVRIPRMKGKRKYFGKFGTKVAQEKYTAWVKQYVASDGHIPDTSGDALLQTAVNDYLVDRKDHLSPITFKQYKTCLGKFTDYMGPINGSEINQTNFRSFQKYVSSQTYVKGGRTRQMTRLRANDVSSKVKVFIKWAVSHGKFPIEVWHRVQVVDQLQEGYGRETSSKQAISWEVLQKTLPFLSPTVATMCQVQYLCGMRPGEVCRLRRDFDREKREGLDRVGVMVGDMKVWLYIFIKHKTSKKSGPLVKAIPPAAQRLLEQWENRGDCGDYFFSPRQSLKDNYGWNGPWEIGKHPDRDKVLLAARDHYVSTVYADSVQAGIQRAIEAQPDLPAWSPNQLRHGMATFIRETQGIEQAGIYAGHKRVDTTLIYASEVTQKLVGIAAAFEQALAEKERPADG